MKRAAFVVLVAALLVTFAALVWPTGYRAIAILSPPADLVAGGVVAARENRFTGTVEWLPGASDRWVPGVNPATWASTVEEKPKSDDAGEELARLADRAREQGRRPIEIALLIAVALVAAGGSAAVFNRRTPRRSAPT